jgi:uncharacterized membrane protein YidH (DUF202 family)
MMATWEQILLGIAALALTFLFWPGVKASLERSRQAQERDWLAVLLPIGAVVLFVVLLIVMVRS